jgi:hypothetical protein
MTAAGCTWAPGQAQGYVWRAIDWHTGQTICERPAGELPTLTCDLWPLDHYLLRVYEPNYQTLLCRITIRHDGQPDPMDYTQCVGDALSQGNTVWKYELSEPETDPEPLSAACTLPPVDNSIRIATSYDYQLLAGRLAWWGIDAATDWQNRFDEQFRGAADAAEVPVALLKAMVAQESQFWPLWDAQDGEVGWMQLTWSGADTALRHDPELFSRYCRRALWGNSCFGYDLLTMNQRRLLQAELVKDLQVAGAPGDASIMAADDLWLDAHILRAYACQAQDLYPGQDVWQAAAVLYNAGTSCITNAGICPQGQKYLDKVMQWKYLPPSP